MIVAGFDTETTGLDVVNDQIIEVGVVLWDTERKKPMRTYSAMVAYIEKPLDPKITELTGITTEDLAQWGSSPQKVLQQCLLMFAQAKVVVAHNGNLFDRPMFEHNCARHELPEISKDILWVDTSCDIEFPAHISTRKLTHLAAEHGFVNPFQHRALFDVLTMLKVADLYPWDKTLEWAKTPNLVVQGVSTYHQREVVKRQGYRWEGESKRWLKTIKEFQLKDVTDQADAAGFSVAIVKGNK